MKTIAMVLGLASLALCCAAPLLFFYGWFTESEFKNWLLAGSLSWFVFGTAWAVYRDRG